MARIEVNPNFCKACGFCMTFCSKGVISMGKMVNKLGYNVAFAEFEEKCVGCKQCAVVCPEGAISVFK